MISTKIEGFSLRFANCSDTPQILSFIRELAAYEHLEQEVQATEELLRDSIFIEGRAEVLIGEYQGKPVCFALFFYNYSTFLGRPGIYVEDLYVKREHRSKGFGKEIICFLARFAVERGCGRVEWSCLNWNEPSICFYKSLGATTRDEWKGFRLDGEALLALSGTQSLPGR